MSLRVAFGDVAGVAAFRAGCPIPALLPHGAFDSAGTPEGRDFPAIAGKSYLLFRPALGEELLAFSPRPVRKSYLLGDGLADGLGLGLGLGPGFRLSTSISKTRTALGGMITVPVV